MKLRIDKQHGEIYGYTLWLSANDTYKWAHKSGEAWPCSDTSGKALCVVVDRFGLTDVTINGKYPDAFRAVDAHELDAIVSDFQTDEIAHMWPKWERASQSA